MCESSERKSGSNSDELSFVATNAAEAYIRAHDFDFWERHSEQEMSEFIAGFVAAAKL